VRDRLSVQGPIEMSFSAALISRIERSRASGVAEPPLFTMGAPYEKSMVA
jgi:hypothetical protein